MKGMMPFSQFKKFIGVDSLQFIKGQGREFVGTPVGTVFVATGYSDAKPGFITVGGPELKTKTGESLEGTLWLCNSTLQLGKER
jgi:hypothetical protein